MQGVQYFLDFGLEETPDIKGHEPVPYYMYEGRKKGIQGHYNSCYLDATLFCMFAFNDSLDFILKPNQTESMDDLPKRITKQLKEGIINPLRKLVVNYIRHNLLKM